MVERRIIVEDLHLAYDGIFSVAELYRLINNWFAEKGFIPHELRNFEQVLEAGKNIEYVVEPYKKVTDYVKYIINVTVTMKNVKERIVEKSGAKQKLNQGAVGIELTGFLEQDYEHRWEKKPLFYFMRALFDQFIFKVNTDRFEKGLKDETHHLHTTLRAFLNLYRY